MEHPEATCPRPPACGRGGGPPRQAPPPLPSRYLPGVEHYIPEAGRDVLRSGSHVPGIGRDVFGMGRDMRGDGAVRAPKGERRAGRWCGTCSERGETCGAMVRHVLRKGRDVRGDGAARAGRWCSTCLKKGERCSPPSATALLVTSPCAPKTVALGGVGSRRARRLEAADGWSPVALCVVTCDRECRGRRPRTDGGGPHRDSRRL